MKKKRTLREIAAELPTPEVLGVIGQNSKERGTDKLTEEEINAEIEAVRRDKRLKDAPVRGVRTTVICSNRERG